MIIWIKHDDLIMTREIWTARFVIIESKIAPLENTSVQWHTGMNYALNASVVWIMSLTLFGVKDVLIWREAEVCVCVCVLLFWLDDSPGTEAVITIC